MSRLVLLFIAIALGQALGQAALGDRPPNIIFLFADDQRADTIAAHGNPHIRTPNLDRMAERGFSFRRNYCAGSFSGAVCVASRAMLMTGRHWMNLPANRPATNWGAPPSCPRCWPSAGGTSRSSSVSGTTGKVRSTGLSPMAGRCTWGAWRTTPTSLYRT